MLADGRSPAPRAAGDLLIALRRAGAASISPPACADVRQAAAHACSAAARTGTARSAAAGAGRARPAASTAPPPAVDREGRPRCRQCPARRRPDPVASSPGSSPALDPSLPAERDRRGARWRAHRRRRSAGGSPGPSRTSPGLLTGAGAHAPDAGGAAPDRRAVRRRRPGASSVRLPALRPGYPAAPADRRAVAVPQLRGQVPGPAVLPLRSDAGGRHPRRARPAAVLRTA